jgi:hypothetical protein
VVGAYVASWAYHDWYWYPLVGRKRVARYMEGRWGKLFELYGRGGEYPLGIAEGAATRP